MYQSFWHKVPLVRILLAFMCGIGTSMFYVFSMETALLLTGITLLLFIILSWLTMPYHLRWLSGIAAIGLFYCFGILLHLHQNHLLQQSHFSYTKPTTYYLAVVNEEPVQKKKSYKMRAKVIECVLEHGKTIATTGNVLIYLSNQPGVKVPVYGDVLCIPANSVNLVPETKNPEEFNYKRYLAFNHIHHQCYLQQPVFTGKNLGNPFFTAVINTQHYFKDVLNAFVQHPAAIGVTQALLYGFDDDIDEETMGAYANTGTLHVLAVSGMHVGIIFYILNLLLFFLNKNKKLLLGKRLIIIASLWIYSALCGLSPSILRATVMFSFIIVAEILNKRSNIYNTLAASCFCLLCVDANTLANVGFQLSYLAVLGIVFLQPLLYKWFVSENWFIDQIWKITSVSIAAQITTSPIGILYFHQFPNCFLFSNLLIIPLTTIILYASILLLVVSKFTVIASLLGKGIMYAVLFTNWLVKEVEQLPYAYVNGLQISIIQSILLYLLFFTIMGYLFYRKTAFVFVALFLLGGFIGINSIHAIQTERQQTMFVYSIKRNNAIHLVNGQQSLLLIDDHLKADKQRFRFHLQQHIWSLGLKQIDTMATTPNWQWFKFKQYTTLVSGMEGEPDIKEPDILIVRYKVKEAVLAQLKPKQVVIAGTLKQQEIKKIKAFCSAQNIPCHDVLFSGAFQLSL